MDILENINATTALTVISFVFVSILLVRYNWQRRWLYYYASKIEGPLSFPLIGNLHLFINYEEILATFMKLYHTYPSIFKLWISNRLFIINSKPEDLEVLMNTCLEKSPLYQDFGGEIFRDGLITGPVYIWKRHRKIISPSFNPKILNSFVEIFVKRANVLVANLKNHSGMVDMLPKIWRCTLDVVCETMADVDADLVTGQDEYLKNMGRLEELSIKRVMNPFLYPDIIWNLSPLGKEWQKLIEETFNFCKKLIEMRISRQDGFNETDDENLRRKRFLNHLNSLNNGNGEVTAKEILEELQTMLVAASETSAIVMSMVMCVMGFYQDVQEKVYHELHSIFGGSLRAPTLEDLNKMEYLERVIKETMRLIPVAPAIGRYADKDFEINNTFYPKGTTIVIPVTYIHRKEDIWENPSVFDPDRFLPENSEKRHRCAYIPFSFGVRNCIGLKYGMMSMKIILSTLLRNFRVASSKYKSIDDIKMLLYAIIAKPRDGAMVVLERRNGFK